MKGGLACRDDGLAMVDLTGSRAIGWMENSSALGANSWPIPSLFHNLPFATRCSHVFFLPIVLYDLWSTRRFHRVTLWSSAFLVSVFEVRFLVAKTMAWHAIAVWIRSKAA